ncbi:hypothetical protein C1645_826635 [Glomus cerebriforme]|uniref:Uncharacterized protein n=1 Tax=Glomus cerebriforme TaxID=658196 RepID=A0A397SW73_9GLOM|nr:hypothetical protein C1645_826635 [Glomus cerebriforme]
MSNIPSNVNLDNIFASLADLLQPIDEPKCPGIRFVESTKFSEYIAKSCRGNILPLNEQTQRMLHLEEIKLQLAFVTNMEEIDDLIQKLNNFTNEEQQTYTARIQVQLITRLLSYSLQFRRCLSAVPDERITSAITAVSDYKNGLLDLFNPFTTLDYKFLQNNFLEKAKDALQITFNPFGDPMGDIKAIIVGCSPFLINGGLIQPLDSEVSLMENLYRQSAGQYKLFNEASHSDGSFLQFGFKEYVRHKIPMKRVINGAYTCYVDPLSKTYYYTTLTFDPFRFKVLKNLLIYEIVSGKAAYFHSALHFFLSMCTCEEDFQLMIEYGVIQWCYPMEGYSFFCELMKELLDVMYCWKFTNARTWHTELVKIAKWKDKKEDTSKWDDFAISCYNGGLLKTEVTTTLYKSLC